MTVTKQDLTRHLSDTVGLSTNPDFRQSLSLCLLLLAASLNLPAGSPPGVVQHESTSQMYRNYMETGSIYYSNSHVSGPPIHLVKKTDRPLLPAIEHEARRFAEVCL